jgi:hypothetical protein
MIIGSLAPAYRPDKRIRGHEVSFQTDLQTAARARGDEFVILVPEELGTARMTDVVACLPDRKDPARCLVGVRRWLEELRSADEVLVVLYEGSLSWLSEFDALAGDFPHVQFVVNLFFPEASLDVPSTSQDSLVQPVPVAVREAMNRTVSGTVWRPLPQPNVTVLAETPERQFLAEALGVPIVRPWPLHSQLATVDPPRRTVAPLGHFRVLIPLAPRQVGPRVMRDIDFVTRQVDRVASGTSFRFTIAGPLAKGSIAFRSVERAVRPGISMRAEELEPADYAALFAEHDAIWFPLRGHYTTQSSGKALDALVTATPIIAPSGSYAAKQQRRWLPGAPAYDGNREAIELLLRCPSLAPTWRRRLVDVNRDVRAAYSATTALTRLLDVVTSARDVEQASPAPASPGSEGGVPSPQPRPGRTRKHVMRILEGLDLARAFLRFLRR